MPLLGIYPETFQCATKFGNHCLNRLLCLFWLSVLYKSKPLPKTSFDLSKFCYNRARKKLRKPSQSFFYRGYCLAVYWALCHSIDALKEGIKGHEWLPQANGKPYVPPRITTKLWLQKGSGSPHTAPFFFRSIMIQSHLTPWSLSITNQARSLGVSQPQALDISHILGWRTNLPTRKRASCF